MRFLQLVPIIKRAFSSPTYPAPSIRRLYFSFFTHIPSSKYSLALLFAIHFTFFTFHFSLFTIHYSLFTIHSLYFSSDHFQVFLIGHSKPYRFGRHYLHHIALCHSMAHKGRNVELRLGISLMFGYKGLK